jgi:hypothetical protein
MPLHTLVTQAIRALSRCEGACLADGLNENQAACLIGATQGIKQKADSLVSSLSDLQQELSENCG